MRLWVLLTALIVVPLGMARPAVAQALLPANFAGWQAVAGSAGTVSIGNLPAGDASLLEACHLQSAQQQSYQKDGQTISIRLYRLGDPTYGYSAYSLLRPQPVIALRPSPHSAIGRDRAMILVGNFLIEADGQNLPAYAHDFSALVAALRPHASSEAYPTLWQYLPAKGYVQHSDRYALDPQTLARAIAETGGGTWAPGDWLGFDDEVEAETARYVVDGRKVTLLLASYPTPQLAAAHVEEMARWFAINPKPGEPATEKPVVYERTMGSLAGFVAGAPDPAAAAKLLDQIQYHTIVTWNEPGFKASDLTMADYVVGAVLGTMSILLITLVAGIALGFIRVGMKRMFPGLIFDRKRSIEILQLGLTSKPIDPTDFY